MLNERDYPMSIDEEGVYHITIDNKTQSIYNILGETIKKYSHVDLISKNQIVWNGLDKYGNEVSTGTYFVILVSDNKIQTRKVVFAK
jgi:flagellar hook assembly protein FlgD